MTVVSARLPAVAAERPVALHQTIKLVPLLVSGALLILIVADGPVALRLPLAVAGAAVAGAPAVGLLRLPRHPTRPVLVIATSLGITSLVSEALVLADRLSPTTAAVGMLLVVGPTTVLWWRRPEADRAFGFEQLRGVGWPPWLPIFMTGIAALLWVVAAVLVEPRSAGDAGMITAMPLPWWIGVAILTLGFGIHVRAGISVPLAVVQVGLLIAFLYVIMTVSEPYSRIPTSYTHVGLVDYIVRDGGIASYFDGRYSWPGALALGAALTELAGTASSSAFVKWALPTFVVLWTMGVYAVASALSDDEEHLGERGRQAVPWITAWVFLGLNWVGQDYWSSQAFGFFLVVVALAVVATWWPRRPRSPRTPKVLPDRGPEVLTASQRGGLLLLLGVLCVVSASSHQLSPFMLTGGLVVLWLVDRRDIPVLPVIAGLATIIWFSWGAQSYWIGHLTRLTQSVGQVGDVVVAGTSARIEEASLGRQVVLGTRIALSGAAWLAAAACAAAALRRGRRPLTAACLVAAPFGGIALQDYGGELFLRVFLFSLPFVALLLAPPVARALTAPWPRPLLASGCVVVGASIVLAAFVLARYGNEQFEQVYPEDVAVVDEFYRIAPTGSLAVGNNTLNPFRMGPFADYRLASYHGLAHIEDVDLASEARANGVDHGYILVMEAGIKDAILRDGARPGWERQLDQELTDLGVRERYRQGRAVIYEFAFDDVGEVPERPARRRSLASPFVRSLLGVPAFALACGALLLAVWVGLRHARGRHTGPVLMGSCWAAAVLVAAVAIVRLGAFT